MNAFLPQKELRPLENTLDEPGRPRVPDVVTGRARKAQAPSVEIQDNLGNSTVTALDCQQANKADTSLHLQKQSINRGEALFLTAVKVSGTMEADNRQQASDRYRWLRGIHRKKNICRISESPLCPSFEDRNSTLWCSK